MIFGVEFFKEDKKFCMRDFGPLAFAFSSSCLTV